MASVETMRSHEMKKHFKLSLCALLHFNSISIEKELKMGFYFSNFILLWQNNSVI